MARQSPLRQALSRYYEKHNPSQLVESLLDEIVKKYAGKERQLSAKLLKRYGEPLDLSHLGPAGQQQDARLPEGRAPPTPQQQGGAEEARKAVVTDADRLDFRSLHFDPLFALSSASARPPVPNVQPLDNLTRCHHLLPPDHPDYRAPPQRKGPPPLLPLAPQSLPSFMSFAGATTPTTTKGSTNSSAAGETSAPPVVEALVEGMWEGPMSLLWRCFKEKRRVCVMLRRIDGIRGTCMGFLRAFDRHMNMVLAEAEETFLIRPPRPPPKVPRGTIRRRGKRSGRKRSRREKEGGEEEKEGKIDTDDDGGSKAQAEKEEEEPKPTLRRRLLKQVLLRGDNVVMVWAGDKGYRTCALDQY